MAYGVERGWARAGAPLLAVAVLAAGLLGGPLRAHGDGPPGFPAGGAQLPTGQVVNPAGSYVALHTFSTGAAFAPDGRTVVVAAGQFASYGNGNGRIMVVRVSDASVLQTVNVGDDWQGVAYSPAGDAVYVAGGADASVHVFSVASDGTLTAGKDLVAGACDFVSSVAVDRTGKTVWAACPNRNDVVRFALGAGSRDYAVTNPDMLAVTDTAVYASNWRGNNVDVIDIASGRTSTLPAGDHPTGIGVTRDGRVITANANDATVSTIDPVARSVESTRLALVGNATDSPDALAVAPDGRVLVALAQDNAVAVLEPAPPRTAPSGSAGPAQPALPNTSTAEIHLPFPVSRAASIPDLHGRGPATGPWRLQGLIPSGWYPAGVAVSGDGTHLAVVSARGLGHSAATSSPYADPDTGSAYDTVGGLQLLSVPSTEGLVAMTATALGGIAPRLPLGDNPITAGPRGPIKHVIYVTRENKTYDMVLGDLHPGAGTALVLFPQPVTPNIHKLVTGFSESAAFYYPGYASNTGHFWEDAGMVPDILERSSVANKLPASWHDPTNYPRAGLLVSQVLRSGMTVRTYNEELAQQGRAIPAAYQADPSVFADYDLKIADASRELGWESEFKQFEAHQCTGALAAAYGATCRLPALEYVYLGEDHTTTVDKPGYPTTQAQVADNDYATGKLIDTVSHSPDWASTLVVVTEDDPQGTSDHVSPYRGFIALAGPYVKRNFISNTHYELPSLVGAIDRILGLPPISDFAANARPLDDMFTSTPDMTPYTVDTSGVTAFPFTPLPGAAPASDPASGNLDFSRPDRTIPALAERAMWIQLKGMTREEWLRRWRADHSGPGR